MIESVNRDRHGNCCKNSSFASLCTIQIQLTSQSILLLLHTHVVVTKGQY